MTTFADMVYQLGGVPAGMAGIPFGPKSKYYFYDPVNGSDTNPGTSLDKPKASLKAALDLTTADQHDVVFAIAGDTANNPAAALTWNKDYTHLIGIGCDLPGQGQRTRVVMQAATAATPVITFSSTGCIVRNMQFYQEKAAGAASGTAIVSGSRNYFQNVFFCGPVATDANSYSLKLSGSENAFSRCTIGQHTNARSAASFGLWLFGTGVCLRNKFIQCEFLSWSSSADHALVKVGSDIDVETFTIQFEDCLFDNFGTALDAAIVDSSTVAGHQILLRGQNDFAGCTAVANPLTYVLHAEKSGTKSGLLMATVNES
jgi:hypothetical protein